MPSAGKEYLTNIYSDKTVQNILQSSRLPLRQKIVYLEKVEYLVKNAHYNNIVLNDLNLFNFLVDENDTVKAIDTDNYKVKGYESDINPSLFTDLYNNNKLKRQEKIQKRHRKVSFSASRLECCSLS